MIVRYNPDTDSMTAADVVDLYSKCEDDTWLMTHSVHVAKTNVKILIKCPNTDIA